jgi:hypothetical protein
MLKPLQAYVFAKMNQMCPCDQVLIRSGQLKNDRAKYDRLFKGIFLKSSFTYQHKILNKSYDSKQCYIILLCKGIYF